jgi:hypothetical protein
MIGLVVGAWFLLAILSTVGCAAVAKGGSFEDAARRSLSDGVEAPRGV